jgi:hypothetical protein
MLVATDTHFIHIYFWSSTGKLYGLYMYINFCYFYRQIICIVLLGEMHPDSAVSFSCLLYLQNCVM